MLVDISFVHPVQMRPGDERFIREGIYIGAFSGKITVEIMCNEIEIVGGENRVSNSLLLRGCKEEQVLPLHYSVSGRCSCPSEKQLGLIIWKHRIHWWRLFATVVVSLLLVIPSLTSAFRVSLGQVAFSYGGVVLVCLPIGILVGLLLAVKRLVPILTVFCEKGVLKKVRHSIHGGYNSIVIQASEGERTFKTDTIKCNIDIE